MYVLRYFRKSCSILIKNWDYNFPSLKYTVSSARSHYCSDYCEHITRSENMLDNEAVTVLYGL